MRIHPKVLIFIRADDGLNVGIVPDQIVSFEMHPDANLTRVVTTIKTYLVKCSFVEAMAEYSTCPH